MEVDNFDEGAVPEFIPRPPGRGRMRRVFLLLTEKYHCELGKQNKWQISQMYISETRESIFGE